MLASVIIPTYNRAGTIRDAVDSALAQTHADLEVIVVDDGSTDDTAGALASYGDRITFVRQENRGPSGARNHGAAVSKGKIIAFLDSDDRWLPDKLTRQVALMEKAGPGMPCCVCNAAVKGGSDEHLGYTFDFADLRVGFPEGVWSNPQEMLATRFLLFNQVVAVRREAFEKVGGFNEKLRLLEDFELSVKLSTQGSWGVIRDPLVVKYNDTMGIGVECMADHDKHRAVSIQVISDILASGIDLGPRARGLLELSVRQMKMETRASALRKSRTPGAGPAGKMLGLAARLKMAAHRRLPGWPKFEGSAL